MYTSYTIEDSTSYMGEEEHSSNSAHELGPKGVNSD